MSADLALQSAMQIALKADVTLQALIGFTPVRLFVDVGANPIFPYVALGQSQDVPDLAECIDGWEIFATFHVFSRTPGYGEAKQIGAAIDAVLHNAELTLSAGAYRCLLIERDTARYFLDQDNQTKHGVLDFRALVEPTDIT